MKELTSSQKSIWVTEQFYKGSSVNNISGYAMIEEKIDFEKLEQAIQIVIQKHDNFWLQLKIEDGEVKQVLSERKKVEIDTMVFATQNELRETAKKIAKTPFDVEKSELFKFYIFKLQNGQGGFMPSVHHLISDAWTIALISNEVIKAYSDLKHNQKVETEAIYSYIDYIKSEQEYLQSEKYQKDKTYWEEKFTQIPEVATIPGSKENVDESNPLGNRKKFEIQGSKVEKIKQYCKENKISLYNFFMAIYGIYIGEISDLDEFVIGTPILNRTNFKEKNAMGMFVNMAPFKIKMSQDIDFKSFVKNIASDSMGMLKHQKYSYQHLLENLRSQNKSLPNLYNIFLSYQITNAHQSGEDMNYTIEWVYNGCCAEHIDIQIFDINDTGDLSISYDYKTSIYEESDIENLHQRILNVINQVIEKENIDIKDIEIVTPEERKLLVEDFNKTELKYDEEETVINIFEKQAEKTPNKTAIICNNQKLTYKELNEKASMLARYMIEKGVKQKDIIGIMLNRSPEMIIGLVAILKCGATYLPIDPEYPTERISYMLENSETKLVLVNNNTEKNVPENCGKINIKNIENKNKENLNLKIDGNTLVYLIYTSGSTGKPKGVQITNKNLNNFIKGMKQEIDFNPDKTMISVTTICFDIFGLEMWCALTSGQTLVVANELEQNMPALLNKLCLENNVNMIQTTPSRYSVLFEDIQNLKFFENITEILVGGEALNDKILTNMKKYSKAKIFNVYGPTETTIWSTIKELTNEEKITVGKPIANTQCYILNKNHKLLPINIPGELYIGGDGVSNGYLKRDELNEEKFIKSPFIENSKIYNTNDLAYFNENGEIVHLGRTDFQVKIRGFRIELGEIENAIEKNENVNQAVVVKRKLKNGHDALIAYYTIMEDIEVLNELKQSLNKELPQYMVPQYFVEIEKMPHTPNGKIDRKALPEPEGQETDKEIIKPRDELDKELINIIGKMLRLKQISIENRLLDLGGDSLTAITLSTKILSKYNVQINIKDIISGFTIKDISDYIRENQEKGTAKIKIEKAPEQETYPLSSAQKRIYYNSKMIGENNLVYNMPGGIMVDEILDEQKVKNAFEKIIERHSSLRTSFILQENNVVQKINENVEFDVAVFHNTENEIQEILEHFSKPFILDKDILIRVELHYIDNKKTLLLVESHHVIMDGTALNNLIIEFERLYNGQNLKSIPIQYKDYAVWENKFNESESIRKYEEYWVNKFKDSELSQLNLPYDYKMTASRSYKGNKISNIIDENQFRKIEEYAKKVGISPYMLFISAFFILLYKYTGQEEITLGSPIANRDINETKRMIGMFVNNIVLKVNIKSEETFQEFLNKMKEQILDDISNQPYPYDMLVKKLGIKGDNFRNPLFDVMFTYQNKEENMLHLGKHEAQVIEIDNNISKFNLSLEVKPKTHTINIEYCTDLFKKQTIERMFEHYMNVIDCIMMDNNIKIDDISVIGKKEKDKILNIFNNTKIEYDKNKTISQLFEEQAAKTPNEISIVFERQKITYKELNERANQVANYLRNKGIKPNDIIGIMLPRSLELLIAILGVLKSGACYIPIDPTYPEKRIEYMLSNSQAKLLLTLDETYENIEFKDKVNINNEEIKKQNNENIENTNTPEDMSYIIYTSGSTGLPKGVILKHKSLSNLCAYLNTEVEFLQPECKYKNIASVTTASFDIFIFETLICLQKGLRIILANEDEQRIPILLDKLISRNDVHIIQMTPSRMQIFLDNIEDMPNLSNLKYVTLAGEALPLTLRDELIKLGVKKVYNGYGPSETTVFSTFTDVTTCQEINIGVPLGNTQTYILDKNLKIVPIGVAGELYIAGEGVGKGYLNREDITKERYIKNPFIENSIMYKTGDICKYDNTGKIYYLGRDDNQVKIRGLRIELEEIENKILEYPFIKKVKVIKKVIENREGIVAYFIASQKVVIPELRKHLYNCLPNYMVPSYLVELKEFPYTPNGKIDKNRLPEIENNVIDKTKKVNMPTNLKEEKISHIFKKVLKLEEIGIDDNFFEYGGDSISAMMLQTELLKENLQITYSDIFRYPTVREMSVNAKETTKELIIEKAAEAECYATSSAQKRMYLASSVEKSTLYNITGGILMDNMPYIDKMEDAINKVVERHDILRTYFEIGNDGEILQRINPKLDVKIKLIDSQINDTDKIFEMYQEPFDLNQAPLFRTFLIKLPNGKALFMLDIHHIIFDGVSLKLFLKEISDIYNGKQLNKTDISYKDFAVWERKQLENNTFKKNKEFWLKQFDNGIPVLNMPMNKSRAAMKGYSGSTCNKTISCDLTEKIQKLAKKNNVTPYMIMLSAYYILLYRYTGQEDIVIGTAVSGRTYSELEMMLGMFVNSLPLRQQIISEDSFNKFLLNIKNYCTDCFSNQNYPFDMLVNDLNVKKDTSRNPIFDTMFTYQSDIFSNIDFNGINAKYCIPKSRTSKFDISLEVIPVANKMKLCFEYCTELFNEEFINKFSTHYCNILKSIIENPEIKVKDISILDEKEKNKILYEFNNNKLNHPKEQNVVELFKEKVLKNKKAIAVKCNNAEITYQELDEKSNYIANLLRRKGIKTGDVVGINLNRSIELIISMMGVLKLGAKYMPMYVGYPKERLEFMLHDSNAKIMICKKDNELKFNGIKEFITDFKDIGIKKEPLEKKISPKEIAYIIYTSGSTGKPKGVQIRHENLINFIYAFKDYYKNKIDNKDKFLASTNISFDVSIWEIFLPILNGATLVLYEEEIIKDIFKYADSIVKNEITGLYVPPNILEEVYNLIKEKELKIDKLLVGVEPIRKDVLNKYYNLNENMIIINGYGPTETTICCTAFEYKKDLTEGIVSIGKPLKNDNIYILSKDKNIQPIGVEGEIYVTGSGVGSGYINREEETKKNFLPNVFDKNSELMYKTGDIAKWNEDGTIKFKGRNDNQVKIAGHRIELNEINHAIMEYPSIIKAFTDIKKNGDINYIVSYYTSEKEISTTDIKMFLKGKLAEYMIPNFLMQIDKFPLTPNGKIDKDKLTVDFSIKKQYIEPRDEFEKKLSKIFRKLLLQKKVSIDDNFFELGGDSLTAIKFQVEALNEGLKITYSDIFSNPTIRMLSENKNKKITYKIDEKYDYTKINEILSQNDITKLKNSVSKEKINNVLLIGATGYLGIHILEQLILSQANKIYCLVRKKSSIEPETRLKNYMEFYFGDKYNSLIGNKIIVVDGDITDKKFGQINKEEYDKLAQSVDCVVHTAAIVKHYGDFKKFNDTNVEGTINVINFCKKYSKKMYYISTLSVSGNVFKSLEETNTREFRENEFYINQDLNNVYVFTKFEAEKKIFEAIQEGLNACILRVGNMTNRFSDGKFQINVSENAFISKIKSIIKLGVIQDKFLVHALEFTPVEYCAEAVVKIMESNPEYTVFHLFNNKFLNIGVLFEYLKELDINIQPVSDEVFKKKIELALKDDKMKSEVNGIITDLDKDKLLNIINTVIPNSEFTQKYLKCLDFEWPDIDKEYIRKYVEYLKKIKYI